MHQIAGIVLSILLLVGCSSHRLNQGRAFSLSKVSFSDLPGWTDDDLNDAYPALERACVKPAKEWQSFCAGLSGYKYASSRKLRRYLERSLTPYQVTAYGSKTGRITGYYESELTGSRYQTSPNQIPIYGAPANYDKDKKYPVREDIEEDGLDAPIVAWADDPVDLFLMHVQGSGRMETPDGEIHLGFAGSNNRTFTGIGQILKEENLLEEVGHSMIQMRAWLKAHPDRARQLMAQNDRYIFFREIQGETPIGTAGVPLTPGHSVAVDKSYIPMQTPMWLVTTDPEGEPIRMLVVAQDTGAAIKGGIRADYFFGHGEEAFSLAGRMNTSGSYYLLLPD
ncbi:MAG: MltA domain-containing protein [Alphaproteobacteria bacterium]|nr:MltA domain-containing protein [Alphaproteobacteria bacterium]